MYLFFIFIKYKFMNKYFEYFLCLEIIMGKKELKEENVKEIENLGCVCMCQGFLEKNN